LIPALLFLILMAILAPRLVRLALIAAMLVMFYFIGSLAPAHAYDSRGVAEAAQTVYISCVNARLREDRSQDVYELCRPELRTFMVRCGEYSNENPDLGDVCAFMWAVEMQQVKKRFGIAD